LPHVFNITLCESADHSHNNFSSYIYIFLYCYGLMMCQIWARKWSPFKKYIHKIVLVVTGEI